MKSYTDLEQSKKLAEFLPIESADMEYMFLKKDGSKVSNVPFVKDGFEEPECCYSFIPCWSLAALMKLLPSEFITENKFGKYKYEIKIRKYKLTDDVDIYQIAYGNYKLYEDGNSSWKDMVNTGEKENLIDAVFQMIVWLKENNNPYKE